MPFARIDDTLEMYYEDDAFTDPWRRPETVVLHHGNAKNARLWPAAGPAVPRGAAGGARFRAFHRPPEATTGRLRHLTRGGVGIYPAANLGGHQDSSWQEFSYLAGQRQPPGQEREPQAELPVWLALALQKHA